MSRALRHLKTPPASSAREGGLRYGTDAAPGFRRTRSGSGFRYLAPNGRQVRDTATLNRIQALAIPPAWTDVWIAPDGRLHLQATGRDARGRKQYRYHRRWSEVRRDTKYDRLVPFARALPELRRMVRRDLHLASLSKKKVVALVVSLLEQTLIRIGNEEYARSNRSFGLTTLRDRHVRVRGGRVTFHFTAKSGIERSLTIADRRLAQLVKRCQDLPGQQLFQYVGEDGLRHSITSSDVNTYVRETAGADFTAKDFRTWAGTVAAAVELSSFTGAASRKVVKDAIERVADHLGNTAAVCRSCYIHPAVLEAATVGRLASLMTLPPSKKKSGLSSHEAAVLALLERGRTWRDDLAESARVA